MLNTADPSVQIAIRGSPFHRACVAMGATKPESARDAADAGAGTPLQRRPCARIHQAAADSEQAPTSDVSGRRP
jgi:hypothetical protein